MKRVIILAALMTLPLPLAGLSQDARVYQPVEVTFTSSTTYDNPHRDVQVDVYFTGPGDREIQVAGFWNGGRTYQARFAPPEAGRWSFRTQASDSANGGLHHQEGVIDVAPYTGDDPFARKGWPRLSDDRRYFVYDDGDPVFLLGDWAAEMVWKSTEQEVDVYLADRKAKGFNVIYVVAMSHMYIRPRGVNNRQGQPFVLNEDFSRLNPRYFDYLDRIVEKANEAGIMVAVFPLWGRMIEFVAEELGYGVPVTVEEGLLWARYMGARYAGHNVMWIVAGDWKYEDPEQQQYWAEFGRTLQAASGAMHLTSVHASGYRGSFLYYGMDDEWLDFHTYTAGHYAEASTYTWLGAQKGYDARPVRPVLSLESNFENLFHNFWLHHEDTTGARRIQAEHVRAAAYQGILSGSLGGFTYGANGIWQWSMPWLMSGFGANRTALEALHFPGSSQMTVLKDLMQRYEWYTLRPLPELILRAETETNLPVAGNFTRMLAYFSPRTTSATLDLRVLGSNPTFTWVNPSNGESIPFSNKGKGGGILSLQAPDDNDWLFVAERSADVLASIDLEPSFLKVWANNAPNPFTERTTLYLTVPEPGVAVISVFDVLGRRIDRQEIRTTFITTQAQLSVPTAGLYVYRVDFAAASGRTYRTQGTMISL